MPRHGAGMRRARAGLPGARTREGSRRVTEMWQLPKAMGFVYLLTLLAALHLTTSAQAASPSRQCRKACRNQIAACVGAGGHPRACRRDVLGRCKREGVAACQGEAPALAGSCSSPTVLPAEGGTVGGTTSGTSALVGSCGSSETSPERVYQWTPAVSGTATIQTCGAGTSFDTVLYLRSGVCGSGPEMAAGCNDDACANASGLLRASRITPTVTAGQTYFIVVDGYGRATGTFTLTVTPPGASTTTTTLPSSTPTTRPTTTTTPSTTTTPTPTTTTTQPSSTSRTLFLILMENTDWSSISGSASAPYINRKLVPIASHAEQYYNLPNMHPSLPNYLWLEAGTNFNISNDNLPSQNHQSTTSHLVNMLEAAGVSWKTYQEDEGSGAFDGTYCPSGNDGNWYDVNHNPFVYFNDITSNAMRCIKHVRPYSEFLTDLVDNTVPRYNFIVPDLCHDMHENISCSQSNRILFGDTWLSTEVPKILASQAYLNNGALFITWDEGASGDGPIGMIVLSPKAKSGGYANSIAYDHSSTLRTVQEIFGITPMLRDAATATDLRDLFVSFP